MGTLLTGRQLAAALGVSPAQVTHYKTGGKISEEEGGGYNLEKVRGQLAATLGSRKGGVPRRGDRDAPHCERSRPSASGAESDPPVGSKADLERKALAERVRKEKRINDLAEKQLVNRAEVEAATEIRFRSDAEALLNWPGQIAAEMAAELGVERRKLLMSLERRIREFMRSRSMVGTEQVAA